MSCRQPSLVSRLVARAGQLGRRCITLGEQLRIDSASSPREEFANSVYTLDTAASQDETQTALVDPGTGPTSRNELLEYGYTPEEYVRVVLERHDGRFKQRRLVEEYGWSSSTVSRLLTDLEKRDVVDRYRLGREKVVCSPDTAPNAD